MKQRVRESALDSWLATAIGTSLSENPLPDILEKAVEHFDTIATIVQLKNDSDFGAAPFAKVVHGAIDGELAAIAQLRATITPLERKLRELQQDYQAIEDGHYVNWLTQESDLLDYDPERAKDLLTKQEGDPQ